MIEEKTTIRIPKELEEAIQEICKKRGYKTKSEFIRSAIREKIDREKKLINEMERSGNLNNKGGNKNDG